MTAAATQHFTAAQLARALGRKRQALARALADTRPDGTIVVAGQPAAAWSFAALPVTLQNELEATAHRLGFRNPQTLLSDPPQLWQPAVPLAEIAQASLDKAAKLQRALARALAQQNDPALSAAALEQMAIEDYAREFGHGLSARAIRTLISRTLDRDAGALNFNRLEIYLPENPARKIERKPAIALETQSAFRPLLDAIAAFKYPANPSPKEKSYLWLLAFELYEEKLADGKAPKKLKRALLDFLTRNAPFLIAADSVSTGNAIRVNFQRKYDKWVAAERDAAALADGRAENSGRFRAPELSKEDRDKLIAHTVHNCGGRLGQAWRELNDRRELSEAVTSYYINNPASKSYVPRLIADSVKHEVAMLADLHHGPRQAKLNGAHLLRDWSGVHSLDWMQGDDFTFPIYFKAPNDNGEMILMRGQTLLMIDLRTTRILGFVLIPERNYNANAIRTLITHVADVYGLPRRGFYFEHGTWQSKILTGEKEPLSWPETKQGLTEFGLKFVHAGLPRAKPVERVGGALQNIMEGLPAYVGRNEMIEKFERTQKALALARKGDGPALAQIMDHAEWCEVLQLLCERYNAEKQDGKMTGGLSPNDAFEKFSNRADPPVQLSGHCRYLLAHHRAAHKVKANGITFDFNKQSFNYRNAETGKLIGQTVLTWFNPEVPEILTVTDMNRENPFTIARTQEVPAMDAPPELLAQEMARIAQHQAFAKARYKILKPLKPMELRGILAARETVELGQEIGKQRSAALHQIGEQNRLETKGRKAARKIGMNLPANAARRPESVEAVDELAKLLGRDETAAISQKENEL